PDPSLRRGGCGQRRTRQWLRGETKVHPVAVSAESCQSRRINGGLPFQCRCIDPCFTQRRRGFALESRFWKRHSPQNGRRLSRIRLRLRRRKQERSEVLARRGHARGLLRSKYGHRVRVANLQLV